MRNLKLYVLSCLVSTPAFAFDHGQMLPKSSSGRPTALSEEVDGIFEAEIKNHLLKIYIFKMDHSPARLAQYSVTAHLLNGKKFELKTSKENLESKLPASIKKFDLYLTVKNLQSGKNDELRIQNLSNR